MSRAFWEWSSRRTPAPSPRRRRRPPSLECLESRDLLSVATPQYVLLPHGGGAAPLGSPGPSGTTPSQIRHAYGFDQITFSNGTVKGDGSGTTIAIVDAYDDPNIANDLKAFDAKFNLSDPTFTKVNQTGGTTMPSADSGWASEIALDVEWSHAIAPGANILLVEANSNSFSDLLTAVSFAAKQTGVVAVSMSWGGGEFSTETSFDSTFTTPSGHAGVAFVASSGDSGAPPIYPSISPNVLSAGGTTLNLDSSGNIVSESAWSGSGGGLSAYESQPSYQKGVVTQSSTQRANPDVAYDADPNTGFPVYDSYNNGTSAPWSQFGGTSDAAPQWAALIAIADQGRALNGLSALDSPTLLKDIYGLSSSDFHDITSGKSTGFPNESAGTGYDLATGLGSPVANKIVADLVGQSSTTGATHFRVSSQASATAGSPFTVTVTALDANGNTVANYTGTVHFTSSDSAAVLPTPDYTFTTGATGDNGTHSFSVTLKTAGSQTVTATDTSNSSFTGKATITVNPGAAAKLGFGQQPTNTTVGAVISPAVTVRVLDAFGNLVTSDNTDQVTLTLGNAGGATLGGTVTATVSGGVATFSNLTVSAAGNGYTLTAASGALTGATSASFNVTTTSSSGTVIENFESTETWNVVGSVRAARSTQAVHDGTYGLDVANASGWIYRTASADQLKAGDTASVWLKFAGSADGRAYFGFGAGSGGTLSLVAAPNTGQLILQENLSYGFTDLAAVSRTYAANHWYRLEVDWGTSGKIVGKLYDSNGTTLLASVTATTTDITSGGIAFRAIGHDKYFDTVTATHGVNNFSSYAAAAALLGGPAAVSPPTAGGLAGTAGAAAPPAPVAADHFFAALPAANWYTYWSAGGGGAPEGWGWHF
jgi:hypothetical protein